MTTDEIASVMNFLVRHRAPSLRADAIADILDRLIWCLDDNGEALERVRESWLKSDDRERVEIALAMDETFPFADHQEMEEVLRAIAAKWPELADRCNELVRARPTGA